MFVSVISRLPSETLSTGRKSTAAAAAGWTGCTNQAAVVIVVLIALTPSQRRGGRPAVAAAARKGSGRVVHCVVETIVTLHDSSSRPIVI